MYTYISKQSLLQQNTPKNPTVINHFNYRLHSTVDLKLMPHQRRALPKSPAAHLFNKKTRLFREKMLIIISIYVNSLYMYT
jgi:hypothetical protein